MSEDLVEERMICVCGVAIPPESFRFKIKPQRVTKIDELGRKITVSCTEGIMCTHPMHAPGTGYNYVEWAKYRVEEKERERRPV